MSLVGIAGATGGAGNDACDEKTGVMGAVWTVVEIVAGCVGVTAEDDAATTSGVALVDTALLVASIMLFLASLNLISTFPNSAFNSRNCVSIDSFSAAALALLPFFLDVDLPEGAVVAAASPDGGAVG